MTINELNETIVLEKNMTELADEFTVAKNELRIDIDERITLKALKSFIKDWRNYAKDYSIQKKRITVIQAKGKELLKYLQAKLNKLKKVKSIETSEIDPMQEYLDDFKIEIEVHLSSSMQKYTRLVSK